MVTAPKPPGSRTSISPHAAVLLIAPANVLHGAVRLHGLASSPTPETHVRVACAFAGSERKQVASPKAIAARNVRVFMEKPSLLELELQNTDSSGRRKGEVPRLAQRGKHTM